MEKYAVRDDGRHIYIGMEMKEGMIRLPEGIAKEGCTGKIKEIDNKYRVIMTVSQMKIDFREGRGRQKDTVGSRKI